MKFTAFSALATAGLLAGLVVGVPAADAQDAPDPAFRIAKINADFLSSPQTDSAMRGKTTRRKARWLEVEVNFSWTPQKPEDRENPFLDDLDVEFHVLLETRTKQHPFVLLSGSTPLLHVTAGDSNVAMYVSPRAMERFFAGRVPATANSAVRDVGIQLKRGGTVVASQMLKGQEEFWKNPALSEHTVSGLLLRKSATPFAAHAWDYFEEERPDR